MSLLGLSSDLRKTTFLVSFALISLFAHERLNAQCTIDNLSFTPNTNHDGIVVHGVTTQCNSVTVRFTNPQLPDKSQAVTSGSPFAVEFGPSDGVTATMLQNNFVCGSRNFKGIVFCTDDPNCGHTLDGEFDCTSFCPPSISLSVHTANGDLVDPTPCLAAGSYIVKVNEQVPVSSNPDWDWFVDNVYQTSVVNPSDGFPVSITNGETKTVSLNGKSWSMSSQRSNCLTRLFTTAGRWWFSIADRRSTACHSTAAGYSNDDADHASCRKPGGLRLVLCLDDH